MSPPEPRDEPLWSSISKEDIEQIQTEIVTNRAQVLRRAQAMAIVALSTGIATAALAGLFTSKDHRLARLIGFSEPTQGRDIAMAALERRLASAEDFMQRAQVPKDSVDKVQPIDQLTTRQDSQEKRLSALEAAIMSSPENAISVPLIKRELEALRSENQAQIAFIRTDIDRVFAVGTWVLTGLFTVLAAIATWILSTLFAGKGNKSS